MNLKKIREVSRIEGFSDAVFAISATLLVVSLEVPKNFTELSEGLLGFIAFGFSFAVLILIWSLHNNFFRRYGLQDGTTVVWNSILLFVVLFYVYPLKYISIGFVSTIIQVKSVSGIINSLSELRQLFLIYGAGFVAVFASFAMLYRHALKKAAELNLNTLEILEAHSYFISMLIYVAVGALSVLLALTGIGLRYALPGWIYGILGPLHYIHGKRYQARKNKILKSQ